MGADFERRNTSLESKPEKRERCGSCNAVMDLQTGECRCSA